MFEHLNQFKKILVSGQASLTDDERAVLQNASKKIKNRTKGEV